MVAQEQIPENWSMKKLSDIAPLQRGFDLPSKQIVKGKYPVVYSNGILNYHNKFQAKAPGVVTGRSGTIGKVTYIEQNYWPHNTTLWVTDFKDNDPKFIYYLYFFLRLERFGTGSGVPTLNRNDVHAFEVLIPKSSEEQSAIAQALSDTDALLESLDKLIEKKKNIKQGAMQELLTGKKRLPGFNNNKKFKLTELGAIPEDCKVENIRINSTLKARIGWQGLTTAEYLRTGKFYLVTGTDFKNSKIDWNTCVYVDGKRFFQDRNIQLKIGDILVTKDGTIGKVAYINALPLPATLNSGIFVIRPKVKAYYPLFLFYILSSDYFTRFLNKLAAGSTINHLYQKDFQNFNFVVPEFDEQVKIAKILFDSDSEIGSLERKRDKCKQLKVGLMQQLLTGRIRLKWKS